MPQILIIAIGVGFVVAIITAISFAQKRATKVTNYVDGDWRNAKKVSELITIYLDIAIKYGPNSDLAKSYKFGIGNSELWADGGNNGLAAFEHMTKYFDDALKRNKRLFRWK